MPRPTLPIVQPFEIPSLGFRIWDLRSMGGAAQGDVLNAFKRAILTDWEDKMPAERNRSGFCADDPERRRRRIQRWEAASASNPDLTWDEFEQGGQTVETDADVDPRRPQLMLGVMRDGAVVGAISLINIRQVLVTPQQIQVRAYAVVGIRIPQPLNQHRIWGQVYRYILLNELPLGDGRTLDVFEWTFPTGLDVCRFEPRSWNGLSDLFDELRGADITMRNDGQAVASIRRISGAP